jgi:hypothetical protein
LIFLCVLSGLGREIPIGMASKFMKFNTGAAACQKNGQSDRKRNYAILAVVSYKEVEVLNPET